MLLTAASHWSSNHCISAQKFTSPLAEWNHSRSPCVLDSDKRVCCHHSSSHSLSLVDEGATTIGSCRMNRLVFCRRLGTSSILATGLQYTLNQFSAACEREVVQGPGSMTASLAWFGPVFVWSQQKLSEIAVDREVFRILLGLLSPQTSSKKKREGSGGQQRHWLQNYYIELE